MPLSLITDRWIPVRLADGSRRVIRPDEILDPEVAFPDWPRADLNIACLEMLIGLVFMADPPMNAEDWEARQTPDPVRLRSRLATLGSGFNLDGPGPRFLQDLEPLDDEVRSADALFIDSAGDNTLRNNADLMVHRDRYPTLDLPLAAMALYTLQAFAPSGGQGHRTSMRGGGPLVTLVDPGTGRLWDIVWANVPDGRPVSAELLPWMKPTRTSEAEDTATYPAHGPAAEAFFGMPRRARLVFDETAVVGYIQRPRGTNYLGWLHPLTPYYRQKPDTDLLPVHPRTGRFGYQNWLGVVMAAPHRKKELYRRAATIDTFEDRVPWEDREGASVIVAGWWMSNMKPVDFIVSRQPLIPIAGDAATTLTAMIEAADDISGQLKAALKPIWAEGSARDALIETFFINSQEGFDRGLDALLHGTPPAEVATTWIKVVGQAALAVFDHAALPGLDQRPIRQMTGTRGQRPRPVAADIIEARDALRSVLAGWRKPGDQIYARLGLTPRDRKAGRDTKAPEGQEGEAT